MRAEAATEKDAVAQVGALMDEGQFFVAYDVVREALERFPGSLLLILQGGLSLLRTGAVEEARRFLTPIGHRLETAEMRTRHLYGALREVVVGFAGDKYADEARLMAAVGRLRSLLTQSASPRDEAVEEAVAMGLIVDIFRSLWHEDGDLGDLRRARDVASESFDHHGSPLSGGAAAECSWILGDVEAARALAAGAIAAYDADGRPGGSAMLGAVAVSHLLLGRPDAAREALARLRAGAGNQFAQVVETRQRLTLLAEYGLDVPDDVLEVVHPPTVVLFGGQAIDPPGSVELFFPPHLEATVRAEINRRLDKLGAAVGYCSAACGSDLLFIEAMLEREAEVNIFLPFGVEDFVASRVAYAGERWVRRFHNALKLATTVNFATREPHLGHDVLFRFNNTMIAGMARLRSGFLMTQPHLMLVWDYAAGAAAGSAADFMDQWPDISRLQIIDLDDLRDQQPMPDSVPVAPPVTAPAVHPLASRSRVMRTMLFGDMVGFSKLHEQHLPALWDMIAEVRRRMEPKLTEPLSLIESWGDALYVAMTTATGMANGTFALLDALGELDHPSFGLPTEIRMRIALHAGPVFEGVHPLTGRKIIYGSHVSRAARIEPITVPGHVYASEQFVALLTAEQSAARNAAELTGQPYADPYACEYLGNLSLAKNYGQQPVYHLRRCRAVPDTLRDR